LEEQVQKNPQLEGKIQQNMGASASGEGEQGQSQEKTTV